MTTEEQFDRNRPAAVRVPADVDSIPNSYQPTGTSPWTPEEERAERARLEKPEAPRKFLARYWATLDAARYHGREKYEEALRDVDRMHDEVARYKAALRDTTVEANKMVAEVEKERDELRKELMARHELFRRAEERATGYCKRIEDISAEREGLRKQLEAEREDVKQLRKATDTFRQDSEAYRQSVKRLESRFSDLRERLEVTCAERDNAQTEVEELKKERDAVRLSCLRIADEREGMRIRLEDACKERDELAKQSTTANVQRDPEYLRASRQHMAKHVASSSFNTKNTDHLFNALDAILAYLEGREPSFER
jgi:chromosome segregation ATPase